MAVVVSAATLVAMLMAMVFVLMAVVVPAAALVSMLMAMPFVRLMRLTTAAINAVLMLFMAMLMSIAMCMRRHMPHSFMIMILTAMTAGTAVRMLAVILCAGNMSINLTEGAHIARADTHIF